MTTRAAELPPFTLLARSFTGITLATGSLLLALTPLVLGEAPGRFFINNKLPLETRLQVVGASWVGGCAFALLALLITHFRADPNAARVRLSKLMAPLVVSCFVPVLFQREAWTGKELSFLAFTLALGLGLERLLRPAVEAVHPWLERSSFLGSKAHRMGRYRIVRWSAVAIAAALAGAYVYRIGRLTNACHVKMTTMSSDLAEYDNMFFNALHGHPFRSPAIAGHLQDFSTLQGHAEFGLYLLLPFYSLSPGSEALLWIQSAVVGLTAIPIFLLARARLGSIGGLCFAVAYLMAPAVQQPNFYDFHFTCLGMFFVAWLLFFATTLAQTPPRVRRWRRVGLYVTLLLAFLCREDMPMGTGVLGAFLVLSGLLVRDGLAVVILSSIYFFSMKFAIMPLFGTWWFDTMYEDLKAEGAKGFGAIILTILTNPSFTLRAMLTEPKLLYVLHMTAPVLALWLRRPLFWLAFLPGMVATLLVTNRPPMYTASFQYTYFWVPYVFAAAILATRRGFRRFAVCGALVVCAAALSHQMGAFPAGKSIVGGFGVKTFAVSPAERTEYEQLRSLITKIPPEASVTATEVEGPHASARLILYSLKYTLGVDPDYLLIGHVRPGGEAEHLRQALGSGKYGVVAEAGRFVLAQRGADPRNNDVLWRRVGGRR
ncbi:MAG: DUF2079 domain-containing protein [Polyangiaceae bacterium]|nr:DUF2079 domain-containing protein [Polyangiaceae bacterium]